MDKKVSYTRRKKQKLYLLGINKYNKEVWLVEPSWDCNWYWGFGYMQTFTNKNPMIARDILEHTHFDCEILNNKAGCLDAFKEYFIDTPLSDKEIYILCDYMSSYYTLRRSAELFRHGNSYITSRSTIDTLKNQDLENKINKEMLPELFKNIDKLLSEV